MTSIKQVKSELLVLVIVLFVIIIVSGTMRVISLLEILDPVVADIAEISAYTSLLFNSLIYMICAATPFVLANFIAQYDKKEDDLVIFIEAIIYYVITLCFFEIFKMFVSLLYFDKAIISITDVDKMTEEIKKSTWWKYDRVIKVICAIISALVFFVYCYKKKKTMKFLVATTFIIFLGSILIVLL